MRLELHVGRVASLHQQQNLISSPFVFFHPKAKSTGSSVGQHQWAGFGVPEVCLTPHMEASLPEVFTAKPMLIEFTSK